MATSINKEVHRWLFAVAGVAGALLVVAAVWLVVAAALVDVCVLDGGCNR